MYNILLLLTSDTPHRANLHLSLTLPTTRSSSRDRTRITYRTTYLHTEFRSQQLTRQSSQTTTDRQLGDGAVSPRLAVETAVQQSFSCSSYVSVGLLQPVSVVYQKGFVGPGSSLLAAMSVANQLVEDAPEAALCSHQVVGVVEGLLQDLVHLTSTTALQALHSCHTGCSLAGPLPLLLLPAEQHHLSNVLGILNM